MAGASAKPKGFGPVLNRLRSGPYPGLSFGEKQQRKVPLVVSFILG